MWIEILLVGGHIVQGTITHTQFESIMREMHENGFGIVRVNENSGLEVAIAVNKISAVRYESSEEKKEEE